MNIFWLISIIVIIVITSSLMIPVYLQTGGWATSPGVFDQLYEKGDMDRYLTE